MPGFAGAPGMLRLAGIAPSLEWLLHPCCTSTMSRMVPGGCCSLGRITGKNKPSRSSGGFFALPHHRVEQGAQSKGAVTGHGFGGIPMVVTDLEGLPRWSRFCRDPCSHLSSHVWRYHQCPAWHRAQVPLQRGFPPWDRG